MKKTIIGICSILGTTTGLAAFAPIASAATSKPATLERYAMDCDMSVSETSDLSGDVTENIEGLYLKWTQGDVIFTIQFERLYNINVAGTDGDDSYDLDMNREAVQKFDAQGQVLNSTALEKEWNYTVDGDVTSKPVRTITHRVEYAAGGVSKTYSKVPGVVLHNPAIGVKTKLDDLRYKVATTTKDYDILASGSAPAVHVDLAKQTCTYKLYTPEDFTATAPTILNTNLASFDALIKAVDAAQADVDQCSQLGFDCTAQQAALKKAISARDSGWTSLIRSRDYVGVTPFAPAQ